MRALLVCLALLAPSAALSLDETDHAAGRATIERQLEAFRRNDAATAYAQAAPSIQALFGSPEIFRGMVEHGYRPVINPRRYTFDKVEDIDGDGMAQALSLQDTDGDDWLALYTLERQPDGQWRITGCTLRKAPGDNA